MKQILLKTFLAAMVVALFTPGVNAQTDIIFDPSQLIPADTGYFIGGIYKDKDDNGVDEFYNQCVDEYGDASHNEAGVQQDFEYQKCMLMPTCWPKDAAVDNSLVNIDHAEGYIEITKTKYYGTDSATVGYIISPRIQNLVSYTLEVSADNSSESLFWLEISKDNGVTWEESPYIEGSTGTEDNKKGVLIEYTAENISFSDIIAASTEAPINIRLMTKPRFTDDPKEYHGQRLKVHYLKIVADIPSGVYSTSFDSSVKISTSNNRISVNKGEIEVYNMLGQQLGTGTAVNVLNGVYLVKDMNGQVQKVLVNN